MTTRHKALLIGASDYDEPGIRSLPFVRDDLARLSATLTERGFHSAEVAEHRRGITLNFVKDQVSRFLREAKRDDTLWILLSGHGQHYEGIDHLIPEDASFHVHPFASSCVPLDWGKELNETRHQLLENSHSRGSALSPPDPPGPPVHPTQLTGLTTAQITDGLSRLGLGVEPIPEDLAADIAMEDELHATLSPDTITTADPPPDRTNPARRISLPALASVAMRNRVSFREAAQTATRLGMSHEAEDWFG
ncbi:caspase family protein [Streptomyces sp. NPDC059455]|uniref:caspase family protein n=1 Tax=Streptomyces sp. NPDC059455 TaxID=3346837 RepID=UPI0036B995C1